MSEPQTLDQAALDNLLASVGGDREFLGELIDAFFEDTPRQLSEMRRALAAAPPDAERLRRAAHSLKSSSLNFGAQALAEACRALEEKGKAGALEGAAGLVEQVEAAYEAAIPALLARRAAD